MKRLFALACALVLSMPVAVPVLAKDHPVGSLDMYAVTVDVETAATLSQQGYDIAHSELGAGDTVTLSIILSPNERNQLARQGIDATLIRDSRGRSSRERALEQAAGGFNVWRSWDEAGGIRDELYDVAKKNAGFVKLEVLGHTIQGREIIALKVTQGARGQTDGSRPSALYMSGQHAREWIGVEVERRFLHWILDQRKLENPQIVDLLKTTELWFIVVANPDGYQFTFDHERLWRKNTRDVNGDGQVTIGDGIDLNRNYDEHWNYDNEGSSGSPASDTYRGPSAESEAETHAAAGLITRIQPRLLVNYHSYGPLILYPQGWQVGTPDGDNPIYTALAGTDANPAIEGFDPGMSAEELYVTNGETTDFADINGDTLAFTPELEEGCDNCGFVFPDDEALIQAEFLKTFEFDLAIARSAVNPANPVSPVGFTADPFYLSQTEVDAENGGLSMFDFDFDKSYGDPQEVRVLAKRSLGDVTLNYAINGGATQTASTSEWTGGERYGVGNGTYYHVMGGVVTGTSPGDSVEVWFTGGGATSDSFTYDAVSESGDPVLIMAAEDYTGASPAKPGVTAPQYLTFYEDALDANGIAFDVYDVDANGRTAPDPLGVLGHYDAVIWYTGDDTITREPGWGGGNASRLAIQELYGIRDYLNEGGRVLYTGSKAGWQYLAPGVIGTQAYDPFENQQCVAAIRARCRPLAGSGDNVNDVLEYWFGASILNVDAGLDANGDVFDVLGRDGFEFDGLNWGFNGDDSAQNQFDANSMIVTSGLLPVDDYPVFNSWHAAIYDRPGGPFFPHTGSQYVWSQIADVTYKRLTHTINVPAGGATMTFWTSYDTELEWDHLFVEAHTVGQDNWTTLPDQNGHTSQETGQSCQLGNSGGWRTLHPFLDHYQTQTGQTTCDPTGTTGAWNAASGNSAGWQQWSVDLSAYAGQQVEVSISYASDWATQNLGVFVDDIVVSTGEGTTSFETGLEGWSVPGSPPGSAANFNDYIATTAAGFPEGAVVVTPDTIFMGFGFEGITGADTRAAVMDRVMDHLLP